MENRFLEILSEVGSKPPLDNSFDIERDFYDGSLKSVLDAVKIYTEESIRASLERAASNARAGNELGVPYVKYETIVDDDNIVLL